MKISINQISSKLVKNLLNKADRLNLKVKEGALNCTIIDAGINTSGSIEAGLLISEICLGGLGKVTITPSNFFDDSTIMQISVHSSHPVIACLGSQYAGWSLSSEGFFSLGSGPVRSIAQKEEIFNILKYTDDYEKTVTILEVDNVIICAGQLSNNALYEKLKAKEIKIHLIGGAFKAAEIDAKEAINQAVRLASVI